MIPIVAIHGGLGNQLFQWFYAHTIRKDQKFTIVRVFEKFDFSGQLHFQLDEIELRCSHVKTASRSKFLNYIRQLVSKTLNWAWNHPNLRLPLQVIGYLRESPKSSDPQNSNRFRNKRIRYAFGYFQSIESIRQTSVVESELLDYVDTLSDGLLKRLELKERKFDVIHVRKYPIQEIRQVDIGNLSIEYYANWIRKVEARDIIVLCKEYSEAEFLLRIIPDAIILDDRTVSPWEVISLMSKARKSLSSNSTLSWWGALLCAKNSGDAYLPSDWSYWGNIDTGKLHFNGCKIQVSQWDITQHIDLTCIDPHTGRS